MIEPLPLVWSLIAGLGLGFFYFGGLWLTVKRLPAAHHPTLLTLGSFLGRTGVILLGLYFVTGNNIARLLVGLLGFIVARAILVRRWQPERDLSAEGGKPPCS